jgi:hypothetical protein
LFLLENFAALAHPAALNERAAAPWRFGHNIMEIQESISKRCHF